MTTEEPPLVVTDGLTKRYGAVTALEDCSLAIRQGEVYGLLGPNGAGKTTLLRLLLGFLRPTSGTASIAGLDCHRARAVTHGLLAYLPGEVRLFPRMRGRDVLRFFADVHPRRSLERSIELAEYLDVDLSRRIAFCSTGMRQKIALAAILATDVPFILLDEPTANLDPSVRGRLLRLIGSARDEGRTVLFSSHVLAETEEVCDRVCILRRGALVHVQVVAELQRQHRLRARLLGPLPDRPADLHEATLTTTGDELRLETPGELAPLLGWLATLPIDEVRIEPIGLRSVYDRFHDDLEGVR